MKGTLALVRIVETMETAGKIECLRKIDHYGGMKGVGVLRKMFGLIILVSSIAYSLSAHLHGKEQIDFVVIGEWEFACNFPRLSWQKILILLRKLWFAA